MTIQKGDFITLDYVGRVKGTDQIFDLTREDIAKKEHLHQEDVKYGTVTVVVGAKHVLEGLDNVLPQLKEGEKSKVELSAVDGFGNRDPDQIKLVPMSVFKKERLRPMPGMPVNINNQRGIVLTVSGGRVKVDYNHPLAGKTLEYEVEVHKKLTDPKDQILSLFHLHLPQKEVQDPTVEVTLAEAVITTPEEEKTRRYINLTKEIIAGDILKYIKSVTKVKFVDIFESKKGEK